MTRERDNFLQETEDALKAANDPNVDEIMQQYRSETVGFIIGGFDGNDTGTFQVFHAASDWAFEMYKQENDILAAQFPLPTILLPYLRYSGISVREGAKIATLLMILTEMHENTVGGPIHLATVSYTEGFNLLHNREVAALVNEVQPVLDGIRRSLVDAWFLTDFQSQGVDGSSS